MTTPRCIQPSKYAAALIRSSTKAPIGTTAPCRTAFARIGVRRLGNNVGNSACRAVPSVCDSLEAGKVGVIRDCTTRRWPDVGSEAVGEDGR